MDKWTDRLSEYLDGELSAAETEALEVHLLECAECGQTLHELRGVVAEAARVLDRPPETDLWQAIAARIEQPAVDDVATVQRGRRISFSVFQLLAASVVLMLMTAGSVYLLMPRQQQPTQTASTLATPSNVQRVAAKTASNYEVAITDLEAALKTNRTQLDTATVRILEKNLRAIDGAIAEAKAALERDPGNQYLNHYLDQTMQRKIQLLRRATGIVRAQT